MSVFHYFSKDPNKRAKFIFNFIAPIYGRVDNTLAKAFSESTKIIDEEINLENKTVLDLGTGTGAWGAALKYGGAEKVHGIDMAEKMLNQAKKAHPNMTFSIGDVENLNDVADNSFDIVTASFVLHGVKSDRRNLILSEMERISKGHIIINDFIGKTPFFIKFLEFMEKSDYKNFKVNFCNELKDRFKNVKKIQSKYGSGIYFATKNI